MLEKVLCCQKKVKTYVTKMLVKNAILVFFQSVNYNICHLKNWIIRKIKICMIRLNLHLKKWDQFLCIFNKILGLTQNKVKIVIFITKEILGKILIFFKEILQIKSLDVDYDFFAFFVVFLAFLNPWQILKQGPVFMGHTVWYNASYGFNLSLKNLIFSFVQI